MKLLIFFSANLLWLVGVFGSECIRDPQETLVRDDRGNFIIKVIVTDTIDGVVHTQKSGGRSTLSEEKAFSNACKNAENKIAASIALDKVPCQYLPGKKVTVMSGSKHPDLKDKSKTCQLDFATCSANVICLKDTTIGGKPIKKDEIIEVACRALEATEDGFFECPKNPEDCASDTSTSPGDLIKTGAENKQDLELLNSSRQFISVPR
jgi:hypothetical protein